MLCIRTLAAHAVIFGVIGACLAGSAHAGVTPGEDPACNRSITPLYSQTPEAESDRVNNPKRYEFAMSIETPEFIAQRQRMIDERKACSERINQEAERKVCASYFEPMDRSILGDPKRVGSISWNRAKCRSDGFGPTP